MLVHYIVCVAHDVCVVLGSSSMSLVSLLLCDNGRKFIIIIFLYHNTSEGCPYNNEIFELAKSTGDDCYLRDSMLHVQLNLVRD